MWKMHAANIMVTWSCFYFEEKPRRKAWRHAPVVTPVRMRKYMARLSHMVKMAANGEKQQGHRAGIYKQKNKGHKHGKHRTKGEIERENKGESCSVLGVNVT